MAEQPIDPEDLARQLRRSIYNLSRNSRKSTERWSIGSAAASFALLAALVAVGKPTGALHLTAACVGLALPMAVYSWLAQEAGLMTRAAAELAGQFELLDREELPVSVAVEAASLLDAAGSGTLETFTAAVGSLPLLVAAGGALAYVWPPAMVVYVVSCLVALCLYGWSTRQLRKTLE